MERIILHVDVNNAFLSWTAVEMLKNGSKLDIRTIPSIIGGDEAKRKGIVLAKSNIAKQLGIKTADPIYFAKKKCPNLQIYRSDFKIYRKYSDALYTLLLDYTDKIERFSIDECFLDLTGYIPKGKTVFDIAKEINYKVKSIYGFTVNIGISNNKVLAKMASDFEKPDKIHTLFVNEIEQKMWKMHISELFLVGKNSVPKLERLGIKTIGDLAKFDERRIIKLFGKYGKTIRDFANGKDDSPVNYEKEEPKGIGNSITLPYNVSNIEKLEEVLLELCEQVGYRLRKHNLLASVVNVQLKTSDFKVKSHQRKMDRPTNSTKLIFNEAKRLLKEVYKNDFIRLIGIRVDNLSSKNELQLSIFDNKEEKKQEKLDAVLDKIKDKYGYDKIKRGGGNI